MSKSKKARAKQSTGQALIDLFRKAGQKELDQITQEIESLEGQLDELTKTRKAEIESLRIIRRSLDVKLNGRRRKPRVARKNQESRPKQQEDRPNQQGPQPTTARMRAREHLVANGPDTPSSIAKACGIPAGSITFTLKHEWFNKREDGKYEAA